MQQFLYISLLLLVISSCQSQTNNALNIHIGGPCEGCEAIHEYGNAILNNIDTITGFLDNEPKLKLEGTIYLQDKKTPASDIILYIYHTNRKGIYEKRGDEIGWAKRHGMIRGWIKTDSDGKYAFYTFRPAAYPGRTEAEHIHLTVKEPLKNEYYIENVFFDDDPLLTSDKRQKLKNRGGSGIVKPELKNGILTVKRNIILGLNIPNYY